MILSMQLTIVCSASSSWAKFMVTTLAKQVVPLQ
jgi:hypothetical protein